MFGRRKPGFAVEVDKSVFENESNEINVERAEEEIKKQIDLMDLLNEGDFEDEELIPFEDLEDLEEQEVIPKHILLAEFIRQRSKGAKLTSRKSLIEQDDTIEETLGAIATEEDTQDIVFIQGDKDLYYYSNQYMSDNYAMIAMFVEDKDLARTIAEMVRWNCKTYPCPTPLYYFNRPPYSYTDEEIELALNTLNQNEKYKDIEELMTGNNIRYFYSTLHMSRRYAKALAESTEKGEYGY